MPVHFVPRYFINVRAYLVKQKQTAERAYKYLISIKGWLNPISLFENYTYNGILS